MDRVEAAQSKLRDVVRFASEAGAAGLPCRQCHHWRADGTCGDIANAEQTFEPATGRYRETYKVPVTQARSNEGLCGPEGILFAPRRGMDFVRDDWDKIVFVGRIALLTFAAMVFLYSVVLR